MCDDNLVGPNGSIPVGNVIKYFPNIGVIGVEILPDRMLELGDEIVFVRKDTDDWGSPIKITSMEVNRQKVTFAGEGDLVGILVGAPISRKETIFLIPKKKN